MEVILSRKTFDVFSSVGYNIDDTAVFLERCMTDFFSRNNYLCVGMYTMVYDTIPKTASVYAGACAASL